MPEAQTLVPVLTKNWGTAESWKLAPYTAQGGYRALRKALARPAAEVMAEVKDAQLRGRGGAGFPTGLKWSFVPQDNPNPKYLVVNGDESEPGTCKDIPLLMASPHTLVEGVVISAYAIGAHTAFIYIRGEVLHPIRRVRQAVEEAYAAGYLGRDILGSGYDLDIIVHAGAGADICGEETALLNSLEGRRGQPRLRPPFPAVAGLYASPTVINNVESIASVPSIIEHGKEWFLAMGTERSKGFTIYSLSGHVAHPGQYEAPLGVTMRQLLELAGGVRAGHELKFFTPGGSSTPILTSEHLDVTLDYEGLAAVGTMLGTKAMQVFDETVSVVRTTLRWVEFYKHESCGKCTPCREGTWWLVQLLRKLEAGQGEEGDVDKLLAVCADITGKSFCTLAEGAVACVTSAVKHFRPEFELGLSQPAWEHLPYAASALFPTASEGARA
ncbi:MAG: NADH-quinone oxidoreductase subunit NuoF [Propionibacteriaceae bacterium]|jgi:NADH-quinone oxidoreductase subunit F|nr:NADH-quinone oxidoreductase subunit NuoF [Propionibacteriaceae bacterium]